MTNKKKSDQPSPETTNPSGIRGEVNLTTDVVSTLAGLAAREIDGIHSIGQSRILGSKGSPMRGIVTELGKSQVAFDIEIVTEYGRDIRALAKLLRERIALDVREMAGREVVEININVIGIHVPTEKPVTNNERRIN